jgi:hypothetical protein
LLLLILQVSWFTTMFSNKIKWYHNYQKYMLSLSSRTQPEKQKLENTYICTYWQAYIPIYMHIHPYILTYTIVVCISAQQLSKLQVCEVGYEGEECQRNAPKLFRVNFPFPQKSLGPAFKICKSKLYWK